MSLTMNGKPVRIDALDEGLCMMLKSLLMKCLGYNRRVSRADATGTPMSGAIQRHAFAGPLGLAINLPAAANASGAVSQAFARNIILPFRASAGRSSRTALFI